MYKYDIFISYSRKDTAIADKICEALGKAGISYFIDRQDISGAVEFPIVLAQAICDSELFLFIGSKNSYEAKFTNAEITFAFNKKKPESILPYIIDKTELPIQLQFIFACINRRNIFEHPIETTLVRDLRNLLGKRYDLQFTINSVNFNMISVDGGSFFMGSNDDDAFDSEKPIHREYISDFFIGETVVTQALWEAVMGDNIMRKIMCSDECIGDNFPMVMVNWIECQEFIHKLNDITQNMFRLPSESEWEYAARGANLSKGYKYSGSDNISDVAWYCENSDKLHPVCTKKPNEIGLFDMSGNVLEWTQDLWSKNYDNPRNGNYDKELAYDVEPIVRKIYSGSGYVVRGGGWGDSSKGCRVSFRDLYVNTVRYQYLGFRLAL